MHTVDHWVLNGRAIKIIYIIHVEWLLLFVSMDNGCNGCFAAQNLTEERERERARERESERARERMHAPMCEGPSDCEALRTSVGLITKNCLVITSLQTHRM